jgi:hypothetical protein
MIEFVIQALLTRHEDNGQLERTIHVGVLCEQCGRPYGYALTRSVGVQTTRAVWESVEAARKTAFRQARRSLDRILDRECDPVPCPECGWLQKKMLTAARREHFGALPWSATFAFILAGIVLFLLLAYTILVEDLALKPARWGPEGAAGLGLSFVLLLLCGGGAWLVHRVRRMWFDPNSIPVEERIERGRERALTWEEFQVRYPQEDEGEPEA